MKKLTEEQLIKYKRELLRIRKRLESVPYIMSEKSGLMKIVAFESATLQLRMVMESAAMIGMVIHKDKFGEKWENYDIQNNGRKIIDLAKIINPNFYPKPYTQTIVGGVINNNDMTEGYLKLEEYNQVYEDLGWWCHSENPYGKSKNVGEMKDLIEESCEGCEVQIGKETLRSGYDKVLAMLVDKPLPDTKQSLIIKKNNK